MDETDVDRSRVVIRQFPKSMVPRVCWRGRLSALLFGVGFRAVAADFVGAASHVDVVVFEDVATQ